MYVLYVRTANLNTRIKYNPCTRTFCFELFSRLGKVFFFSFFSNAFVRHQVVPAWFFNFLVFLHRVFLPVGYAVIDFFSGICQANVTNTFARYPNEPSDNVFI
jgi:hypothetical protein